MVCISSGKIGINIIPILTGCVFAFINRLLLIIDGIMLPSHPLLLSIFFGVAGILSIFPLIIFKLRNKNLNNNEGKNVIQNDPTFNHTINKNEITKEENGSILFYLVYQFRQKLLFSLIL